jgi:hypothetical protein
VVLRFEKYVKHDVAGEGKQRQDEAGGDIVEPDAGYIPLYRNIRLNLLELASGLAMVDRSCSTDAVPGGPDLYGYNEWGRRRHQTTVGQAPQSKPLYSSTVRVRLGPARVVLASGPYLGTSTCRLSPGTGHRRGGNSQVLNRNRVRSLFTCSSAGSGTVPAAL